MSGCNREIIAGYLSDQLELEDKLDFLFHVDKCSHCWEEIYNATKALHPHYYKKGNSRQVKLSERELRVLEQADEVFEVA
jgi:hypothetical protein